MDIYVYKDELSSSQLRPAKRDLSDAISKMSSALSSAENAYGYEGRLIFEGQIGDLRSCLSELTELTSKLEQYATMMDAAPSALIEADAQFNNVLSSGWDRFMYGVTSIFGLFSTGSVRGKTGSTFDIDNAVESNVKKWKDDIVNDYRNRYGIDSDLTKNKQIIYSSKTTKTVSILPGSSYTITRYRDYKELSCSESSGDSFYDVSSGLSIHGEHYEIESNDGTSITVDTNALDFNLNGSIDPAKGNAYVNLGAEYNLAKATVMDVESTYHKASVSFQAGVGGHIDAGFHDGKFTVDVGAALGIGASVKLEFNYLKTWKHIRSMFS